VTDPTQDRSGIGVVVNPHARRNRDPRRVVGGFERILGDDGVVVTSPSRRSLLRIAEVFHRSRIDVLAISGGDGSVGFTLDAFEEIYGDEPLPRVLPLRGGTMNTIANSVGVPRLSGTSLLARLAARHRGGNRLASSRRVAMRVEDRLGFLFGTGLSYGFLGQHRRPGRDREARDGANDPRHRCGR